MASWAALKGIVDLAEGNKKEREAAVGPLDWATSANSGNSNSGGNLMDMASTSSDILTSLAGVSAESAPIVGEAPAEEK